MSSKTRNLGLGLEQVVLINKEAAHLSYQTNALHLAALTAIEEGTTLEEFQLSAGIAYARFLASYMLTKMNIKQLRYLALLRKEDTETSEAMDAWFLLSEEEQDTIERYLSSTNHLENYMSKPKFRYYVLDTFDGNYKGTNNVATIEGYLHSDEHFVLDAQEGKFLSTPDAELDVINLDAEED